MILCDTDILIEFFKNNEAVGRAPHDIGQDHLELFTLNRKDFRFTEGLRLYGP